MRRLCCQASTSAREYHKLRCPFLMNSGPLPVRRIFFTLWSLMPRNAATSWVVIGSVMPSGRLLFAIVSPKL